jgi:hypothetical protein
MDVAIDIVLFVVGLALAVAVLDSVVRTFVLPRGAASVLTRVVFIALRGGFDLLIRTQRTYEGRDRIMAFYAPIGLLVLTAVWIALVITGFTCMFRALSIHTWRTAFEASGSSLLTLGFVEPPDLPTTILVFSEAVIGLAVLALLISYLPTIYGAFSRRESMVSELAIRSGTPPSGVSVLTRAESMERFHLLDDYWVEWARWFTELEETHTSLAVLPFFRSPVGDRSWITASGAILDAASLLNSTVDVPWSPQAGLCVRSGYGALRSIASFFGVPFDSDPSPTDPISVARDEFDDACRRLESSGIRLKADREQAWRDFAGWRVNYDRVLIALAGMLMAPYAPWCSDRSLRFRVPLRLRRGAV